MHLCTIANMQGTESTVATIFESKDDADNPCSSISTGECRSGVAIAYHMNETDTLTFNVFDHLIHDFAEAPLMKPQITRLNAPCINP